MSAARKSQVVRLYAEAIRTINKVFHGDLNAIRMGLASARNMFESNRQLTSADEIDAAIREGKDGIHFLGQHIVQGKMDKENTYSIKVESHHGGSTPQGQDEDLAAFEAASPDVRDSGPHAGTLHIRTAQDSLKPLPEEGGCCGGDHHDHDHDHDHSVKESKAGSGESSAGGRQ